MSELEEKEEEIKFEIEMGSHINSEQKIHTLSIMNSCPHCGCRMDSFGVHCDYCGYVKLAIYEGKI